MLCVGGGGGGGERGGGWRGGGGEESFDDATLYMAWMDHMMSACTRAPVMHVNAYTSHACM